MNDTTVIAETIPAANMPIKLGVTKAAIKKLKSKYKDVPDATTADGYKKIKVAKAELTPIRTGIEKERKLQVAAALAHQKRVNAEAKEITSEIESIETPLYAAKKAVDDEAERIKKEAEEKEAARIENIESMIADVNNLVNGLLGSDSETILERLKSAKNIVTSQFEEYEDVAIESIDTVIETLQKAYDDRLAFEKQQAEQEEQARVMAEKQAELDVKQAEIDAKEAAQKQDKRDEQIKAEAASQAKLDAEKSAQAEIDAANERKAAAEEAVKQAQRETAETEARVKREAEEKSAAEKAEADEREADKKHKAEINNAAVTCLVDGGIDKATAKKCITIIAQRKVDHVVISY